MVGAMKKKESKTNATDSSGAHSEKPTAAKTIVVSPDLNMHLKILAAKKGVTVKKFVDSVLRQAK